ncbi:MAG: tRNA uridine(34) 5-carboxymethylaminomethyl modification radical SAM/GNAT enzyme Elp3 [Candidatus Peregrinibacteria bacterium]|nr:tRNA uridine(34) 5-carboxymethylaminomethyl modification radical SAM/GNAT enzyme Elp3 [Candidatus Peregrinibacteria bacterium]
MSKVLGKKQKIFGKSQKVENPELVERFLKEIIKNPPADARGLEQRKYEFSKKHKIPIIQNRDLIVVGIEKKLAVPAILQKRKVRTISGVSPIGVLTKPFPCPGKCIYCPTDVRMPKSYLSTQPAAARALRNKFHPFDQVKNRVLALEESGHPVSKLEVIVMGGTWSFLPKRYQSWFVRGLFFAANGEERSNDLTKKRTTLKDVQKINETAERRIIGLTLETRPDFITEKELVQMRKLGCTRIEIGVQTLDDEVQKLTNRGHFRKDVVRAMKLMKDFGFKVCFHLMPGLPGSDPEKDLAWMKEIFENPDFCPDFIKIYPCQVLPQSELEKIWKRGEFKPYDDKEIVKLLARFQKFVPEWARVMRLMRDIPVANILDGAKFSNLRQILESQPKKLREIVGDDFYEKYDLDNSKNYFRDIRSREIGFSQVAKPGFEVRDKKAEPGFNKPKLVRRDYDASGGKEVFLSFESSDEKHLYALLRLRKPSGQKLSHFNYALKNAALIREVHSYGGEISVGEGSGAGQHRGFGKKLMEEAERIAREEWGLKKISVIAGVGTREYYRKFGYELKSTYMVKKLI